MSSTQKKKINIYIYIYIYIYFFFLNLFIFYKLVLDRYSVSANMQVQVLKSISGRKKWYWNLASNGDLFHLDANMDASASQIQLDVTSCK